MLLMNHACVKLDHFGWCLQQKNLTEKNTEYLDRIEKQNLELSSMSSKLREALSIQAALNDEVNEKTEEICRLHSVKSRLVHMWNKHVYYYF